MTSTTCLLDAQQYTGVISSCKQYLWGDLQVHDVIIVMDEGLRPAACQVATALRQAGRIVDVVLEAKKMKQVFKVQGTMLTPIFTGGHPLQWISAVA